MHSLSLSQEKLSDVEMFIPSLHIKHLGSLTGSTFPNVSSCCAVETKLRPKFSDPKAEGGFPIFIPFFTFSAAEPENIPIIELIS